MMKKIFTIGLVIAMTMTLHAQQHATCDGVRYLADTFAVDTTLDVLYGNNTTYGGTNQDLRMDIFEPSNDNATARPAIFLAFGGSFISGTRQDMHSLCQYYAERGYVAISIDYRLYDGSFFPLPDSIAMTDVVIKAVSDMKAAIRYMHEDAATTNTYKVDTNWVFTGGISAGGILASHVAYVDSTDTFEPFVLSAIQSNGGWDGNSSTNTQYGSEVRGVVNFSGALRSASYMDANDPPLFSAHDDTDGTVPYMGDYASIFGFPIIYMEGSGKMHPQANTMGINNFLITIPSSTGHVSYFGNNAATWEDTVLTTSLSFLHEILCPSMTSVESASKDVVDAKFYPNPASSDMTIELTDVPSNYSIAVVNQMGQVVYQQTNINEQFLTLERQGFAAGIYFVQLQFDAPNIAPITTKVIFR